MLIPGAPVRQTCKKVTSNWKDNFSLPFPFLSGAQTILSSGREALYFGLKLFKNIPKRVHIPAYCCKSVLSPFKQLGIEIIFYDINNRLQPVIDNSKLREKDLLLLIHYFGIPQNVQSIKQLCEQYGVFLIEDCAHTLPDPQSRCPMGSTGIFSIYSLRKQLPVPDGGVLVVNDNDLKKRLSIIPKPKIKKVPLKKWLIMNFDRIAFFLGWPNTLRMKDALRDKIGSTESIFYSRFSNNEVKISYLTLKILSDINFNEIMEIRKRNYSWLVNKLKSISKIVIPFPNLPDGAVPQGLPILVENADFICSCMRELGIGVDKWPAKEFPKVVVKEKFHGASYWNNHLLLLPIHQDLSIKHLEFFVNILEKVLC